MDTAFILTEPFKAGINISVPQNGKGRLGEARTRILTHSFVSAVLPLLAVTIPEKFPSRKGSTHELRLGRPGGLGLGNHRYCSLGSLRNPPWPHARTASIWTASTLCYRPGVLSKSAVRWAWQCYPAFLHAAPASRGQASPPRSSPGTLPRRRHGQRDMGTR